MSQLDLGSSGGSTSPLTTKGDIFGHSTVDARIPVGSNGQVLTADSAQTLGLKWATPAAAGAFASQAVSTNITLATGKVYLVDTSSARSLQLPSPVEAITFYIKDVTGTASTNNITVLRSASEQIEGVAASKTLQTDFGSWLFWSNGTDWFLL